MLTSRDYGGKIRSGSTLMLTTKVCLMNTAKDYLADGVKTFLVLDFDGVLNQFPRIAEQLDLSKDDLYLDFVTGVGRAGDRSWPLTGSRVLNSAFQSLLEDETLQLVWLTTWRRDILPVQSDFLRWTPARPAHVLDFSLKFSDYGNVHSKTEAFLDFFASADSPSRLAWVDDDVVPQVKTWLAQAAELADEPRSVYDLDDDDDDTFPSVLARWGEDDRLLLGPHTVVGLRPSEFAALESFVRGDH